MVNAVTDMPGEVAMLDAVLTDEDNAVVVRVTVDTDAEVNAVFGFIVVDAVFLTVIREAVVDVE